jgi:broad specificity phosphatase PhoE
MPALWLVRHAQASFGAADYDELSELGRRQAAVLGTELARRGVQPDVVVSGGLRRQLDTAALAAKAAGWPDPAQPRVDRRWDEYDHVDLLRRHAVGAAAGPGLPGHRMPHSVQDMVDAAVAHWVAAGSASRCVRTYPSFRDDVTGALHEVLDGLGRGGSAVVVTSGTPIGVAVAGLLRLSDDQVIALTRVVVNASVTAVVRGRRGTSLLTFNEHAHLAGDVDLVTHR